VQYPEEKPKLAPRWRGRIILSRDPRPVKRLRSIYLCSVACPGLALHTATRTNLPPLPVVFRINFSRCISAAFARSVPTYAIQTYAIPRWRVRPAEPVYEKEHMLI